MNHVMRRRTSILAALLCAFTVTATHAQTAESTLQFERGFPIGDTAQKAYDASDLRRAIEAYKFFFPTMGSEAVMQQMLSNNAKVNEIGHVMAVWPRIQFGAANSDTPYALATIDLKLSGPMVIELPPGPFIAFVDDHNMRWVQDMGTIGPEKGKGGKHLILPPGYEGEVPSGYYVGRSKTWKVVSFIRLFPADGDVDKALLSVKDVKIYPLAKAGQPSTFRYIDVSSYTMPLPILKWEKDIEYFRQLHAVIQTETAPEEIRPMLGMLQQLGIEKGKPFNPDARMKRILSEAAQTGSDEMRATFTAQRDPGYLPWKGRAWEWLIWQVIDPETKDFGPRGYYNLEPAESYYWMGYGASAAMGVPAPGAGSVYWGGFRDNKGAYLDGGKNYKLTVPAPVPVNLFWSHTVYGMDTRTLIATDQDRAAVRSHIEKLTVNADGSYTLYFGPMAPAGKEGMWIKTIPGIGWWSIFRIYGPTAAAFDGTWKLDDYVEVK
jgi:hypothetical protein